MEARGEDHLKRENANRETQKTQRPGERLTCLIRAGKSLMKGKIILELRFLMGLLVARSEKITDRKGLSARNSKLNQIINLATSPTPEEIFQIVIQ